MKEWLDEYLYITRSELLVVCVVVYISSKIDFKGLYIIRRITRFFR